MLLWNSNLTVCLVFHLAILVWRLNRRDKKTTKTSIYNWKKRNFHSYPSECFLSRYNSLWHWLIFEPSSFTNSPTEHTTSWHCLTKSTGFQLWITWVQNWQNGSRRQHGIVVQPQNQTNTQVLIDHSPSKFVRPI